MTEKDKQHQRGFQQMNELKSLHTQTRLDVAPHLLSVCVIIYRILYSLALTCFSTVHQVNQPLALSGSTEAAVIWV